MKTDNVYTGPSSIQGTGVFAGQSFKKGDIVMAWDLSHVVEEHLLDTFGDDGKYLAHLGGKNIMLQDPEKYVCHSCAPNMVAQDFKYIALCDITKDEELTAKYSNEIPLKEDCLCPACNQ